MSITKSLREDHYWYVHDRDGYDYYTENDDYEDEDGEDWYRYEGYDTERP